MPAVAPSSFDRLSQERKHAWIALVEVERDHPAVAIDSKGQLGEVVRADREAIEALGELVDQEDVFRDLAHDVDLKPVVAALQALLGIIASTLSASSKRRQNGIMILRFFSPISARTRRMAAHSSAKASR
jgi:hypothetical protein